MSTLALKDSLHKMVVETDDDVLLQQVQFFFLALKEKKESKDWWSIISQKEKALIERGLDDAKNSRLVSNAEARQSINQLLGK